VLRLASLGSGSSGNALVVEATDGRASSRVLIDNGFNLRQLEQRLQRIGLAVDALDAVFVTHEHSDHAAGVAALARRRGRRVYCTAGTAAIFDGAIDCTLIAAGDTLTIGALAVNAYAVPHDAAEPVQYTFTDGARCAGLLTDAGESSDAIVSALSGLHALVLECNHDEALLRHGPYPAFLKARIAGSRGHLSNRQAAGILEQLDRSRLGWIAAAHLSASNNRAELAQGALAAVLGCAQDDVTVAAQADGFGWREV
jgi:phosphoribosyl 1,2-cyclic phosphodiesterase